MSKKHRYKYTLRVGQSKITTRKIRGKKRRVRVTKKTKDRYSVRIVGAKKCKRKHRR